ncbi:MAG: hypothetical protein ACJAVF_000029 [Paraglaciecola sp.]|jgi:uncharacterized protein YfaS (alpha-2-macroglobulin family)
MKATFNLAVLNPIIGSMEMTCTVYPSIIEEVVSGLDRMLRQPTGCFEQTSSKNYPNLLVLNYLKASNSDQKELMEKATNYLDAGYKRLLGFEVKGGGFDWYGKPPAHEGLTAYGLMQFVDRAKIYQVEPDLIDRTVKWLLGQRDGKGGWLNSKRALHRWQGMNAIANAYIVWAMTEAGYAPKISAEIKKSMEEAITSKDPYLLGLMANVASIAKIDKPELLEKLLAAQNSDGSWTGKTTSMTKSQGVSLTIETTALSVLALMKNEQDGIALQKAISFIGNSKNGYGFGSTQSTVLAMKALVEYAAFSNKFQEAGMVELFINGKRAGKKEYSANDKGAIIFKNLEYYLIEKSTVKIQFSKTKTPLPYDLELTYTTKQPRNSVACLVDLQTNLQKKLAKMGENIRLTTILTNKDSEPIPNTIGLVGIPAGLSVQPWQLKEMQEKKVFDYYEIMPDGYIAFHYRSMEANEMREIHLDLKADIPENFEAPASKAYLYYWNEAVVWNQAQRVRIE